MINWWKGNLKLGKTILKIKSSLYSSHFSFSVRKTQYYEWPILCSLLLALTFSLSFDNRIYAQEMGAPNTALVEKKLEDKKTEEKKNEKKSKIEEQDETVDFGKIKDIIKNDKLESEVLKNKSEMQKIIKNREEVNRGKYKFPTEEEFWAFMSEYWLVKNASILKWDFQKPDYNLEQSFTEFLESRGMVEKKFKILLIDSPIITHFALPYRSQEFLFVLSVPFIRTLDLSKLEISILFFEDILRIQRGQFAKYLDDPNINKYFGGNFSQKKIDFKKIKDITKKYDTFIFDKGFDFQQMFEVTREMDHFLRSDLKIWNTYVGLLKKIDELAKNNLLYQKYNELYPSPELQLSWLIPKKDK